ncbi:MAG: DUF3575 domain-containing protein [Fermentimonas sp.]
MKINARFFAVIISLCLVSISAKSVAQDWAFKMNLPYLMTTSPNVGGEIALDNNFSLELNLGFNPFKFGDNKKFQHYVVWPELRYWLDDTFKENFFGLHFVGGIYDLSGWDLGIDKLKNLKTHNYKGNALGIGLSYGYFWNINYNLGIELTAGLGYARFNYDVHTLDDEPINLGKNHKNYFGPTKAAISLVYVY